MVIICSKFSSQKYSKMQLFHLQYTVLCNAEQISFCEQPAVLLTVNYICAYYSDQMSYRTNPLPSQSLNDYYVAEIGSVITFPPASTVTHYPARSSGYLTGVLCILNTGLSSGPNNVNSLPTIQKQNTDYILFLKQFIQLILHSDLSATKSTKVMQIQLSTMRYLYRINLQAKTFMQYTIRELLFYIERSNVNDTLALLVIYYWLTDHLPQREQLRVKHINIVRVTKIN